MTSIFKVDSFCDLETVSTLYRSLEAISTTGLISEKTYDIERGLKADEYLFEIDELDELIYKGSTVRFVNKREFNAILKRGFYPGYYKGKYASVFDVYDSCIPNHEEDYLVYLSDISVL